VEQKKTDIVPLNEEHKSVKVDPKEANTKLEKFETTSFDYPFISLVCSGMLALLSVTLPIALWKKVGTRAHTESRPAHNKRVRSGIGRAGENFYLM
jgi:hypothetical protein